ncbi:nuclear transport factor 2 family protein [Clostridium sp.]|uniref:nuclear transport factor 2 family protein n=1 Tax=Clostridium sp. TaxID=1506 RepID=UPI002614B2AD|nr:nuclear transport factor 2 family protein [Clostridium sp.]
MSLEVLEAKIALSELVGKFSILEVDVPAQVKLFTRDTRVKVYMGDTLAFDISGVEELEKIFSQFTATVKRSHHMNGQFVSEVNGDTAKGTLYCNATLVTEENGEEVITENLIYYHDTYVRENGEWLIKSRESHFTIIDKRVIRK